MTRHPPHPDAREYERLDELTEVRRREVLLHAETCAACRESLTRHDPTAIFALLSLTPIPEFSLARLGREIDSAIDNAPPAQGFGWRVVASVAASLLLAVFFGYQALQVEPVRIAETADTVAGPPVGSEAASRGILLPVLGSAPERGLELISSPGEAEVVDFSLGDTHVVMIFDKALDI